MKPLPSFYGCSGSDRLSRPSMPRNPEATQLFGIFSGQDHKRIHSGLFWLYFDHNLTRWKAFRIGEKYLTILLISFPQHFLNHSSSPPGVPGCTAGLGPPLPSKDSASPETLPQSRTKRFFPFKRIPSSYFSYF